MHILNKKIILIFTIFALFLNIPYSYSDDIDYNQENANIENEILDVSSNTKKEPNVNSRSCVVIDRSTNKVLYGKNEFNKVKMASTTKIMTATIIIENCNLSNIVEISKKSAGTGGSRLGLKTGDKITVRDLLYGLLLCSGNDAAVALAEYCSGSISDFCKLMNEKALLLGLNNSHFESPHGLDSDEHYTTAFELAKLTNYALKNDTFIRLVGTKKYTVTINTYPKEISNTNELLGCLNGVYGVKTGFTNGANRCLVTACKRNNLDIICVVLGADTKKFRTQDSIKLIEYVFSNYIVTDLNSVLNEKFNEWQSVNSSQFNIFKGISNDLTVRLGNLSYPVQAIKKDAISNISVEFVCYQNIDAPVYENSVLGYANVIYNNVVIDTCSIYANCSIRKKNVYDYLFSFINIISKMSQVYL